MFLPIKGPGGRALTPFEKAALLVLGVTLVVCVLTLVAGNRAFLSGPARNPIFAVVSFPSRLLGGGIVALYGLVVVWTGLLYFKGERIARVAPLPGRLFAALGVTVGISGALGVARMETAGDLGLLVGGALHDTLGGAVGLPLLLLLVLIGFSLAAQGSWTALREATPTAAAPAPKSSAAAISLSPPPGRRMAQEPALPDDGDPSAEARTLAVTQAMEEVERSQGVTIVDVEPSEAPEPRTVGEEVDEAPAPPPGAEEAEVQRGLLEIAQALRPDAEAAPEAEPDPAPEPEPAPAPAPPAPAVAEAEEYGPPYVIDPTADVPVNEACTEPAEAWAEAAGTMRPPAPEQPPPEESGGAPREAPGIPQAAEEQPPPS
ncbi:MAG: hypothetical protein ACREID_08585, partial [Planctomycetota bacterium]